MSSEDGPNPLSSHWCPRAWERHVLSWASGSFPRGHQGATLGSCLLWGGAHWFVPGCGPGGDGGTDGPHRGPIWCLGAWCRRRSGWPALLCGNILEGQSSDPGGEEIADPGPGPDPGTAEGAWSCHILRVFGNKFVLRDSAETVGKQRREDVNRPTVWGAGLRASRFAVVLERLTRVSYRTGATACRPRDARFLPLSIASLTVPCVGDALRNSAGFTLRVAPWWPAPDCAAPQRWLPSALPLSCHFKETSSHVSPHWFPDPNCYTSDNRVWLSHC